MSRYVWLLVLGDLGLMRRQKTLRFVNDEATSVHGSIRASSIFTTESGEWKLGGLDVLSSMKEDDAVIYVRSALHNT